MRLKSSLRKVRVFRKINHYPLLNRIRNPGTMSSANLPFEPSGLKLVPNPNQQPAEVVNSVVQTAYRARQAKRDAEMGR